MGQAVLTTGSTSPWSVPAILQVAGHKVTLVGSGGNGGTGTTGTSGTSGGGGGGGACTVCTYSSGTVTPGVTTIAFLVNAAGSANATQWQSSSAGTGAFYEALPGGNGAAAGTAGSASGATTTVGTPTITYTPVNHTGAAGGTGGGANTLGGGGGGGAGGPAANGGAGGSPSTSTATGGGGGGGGGAANAGGNGSTTTGGNGGNGSTGAGGSGSGTTAVAGGTGTGSSGGGGGPGNAASSTGGPGGSGGDFTIGSGQQTGCGGGGGGSGRQTAVGAPTANVGGAGGNYGGGGGGIANSRTGGGTSGGGGAPGVIVVVFTSLGIDWQQAGPYGPAPLQRAIGNHEARRGAIKGKSGFATFQPWTNAGWEPNLPTPLTPWLMKVRSQKGALMPEEYGTEARFIPPTPALPPIAPEVHVPTTRRRFWERSAAIKGKSGFATFLPWFNYGWDVQPPQPPRRPWERRGAVLIGDAGNEAPYINWFNFGWEVQPPQPPRRYWERRGSILRGDDGNEAPYVFWNNAGWEIQSLQPPHRFYRSPDVGDSGIVFPMPTVVAVVPAGWEVQSYQPQHRWFRELGLKGQDGTVPFVAWINAGFDQVISQDPRRRWERAGAIMRGDDGTQGPFVPWINFGWEVQPPQPPYHWWRGHGLRGPDGNDARFINWVNLGFEEVISQDPRRRWERAASGMRGPDGTDAPFVNWQNLGFEEINSQEPRRRWERSAAGMRGDDGTEAPFVPWINLGWEQTVTQPLHRLFRSPDVGDTGIEAVFVPVVVTTPPFGWEPVSIQPLHRIFKSPDIGDSGIEAQFNFFAPTAWPSPDVDPRKRFEISGGLQRGIDGTDSPFQPWINYGWDVQPPQPPHRLWRGHGLRGDDGTFFQLIPWINAGWEAQPHQPPHRWFRGHGLRGIDGTDAPFVNWQNFGWDQTASQPLHRFFRSPDVGDTGTEAVFVPVVITVPPVGWEQIATQPFHRIFRSPDTGDGGIEFPFVLFAPTAWPSPDVDPRKRFAISGGLQRGIDGTDAPFVPWLNVGWEVQPWQPPHRWYRGQGLRGDDGTLAQYVNWINAGWEVQPPQPPHRWLRGQGLRGEDGTEAAFVNWINFGWEQTATQPLHRFFRSPDVGDSGIEAVFVFVPPTVLTTPWGFDQTLSQDKHPLWARFAALTGGDPGTEASFVNWLNAGWEVQPWQPPRRYWERRGSILVGEPGIEAPYVFWRNTGWEVQPPPPPRRPWERRGAILRGDEGNQAPFMPWINLGWEQIASLTFHRIFHSPDVGDAGIQARFTPPVAPPTWWATGLPELPRLRWERRQAIRGKSGFAKPPPAPPLPVTAWPTETAILRRTPYHRRGGIMIGDYGIVFPFVPPPPFVPVFPPTRRPTGKIFTIDTLQSYFLGEEPVINESCVMIFVVGPGLPIPRNSKVLLTFHRPDGTIHLGDTNFAFIGQPTVNQRYIKSFPGGQYIVYTFAQNELNQAGTWTVSAIADHYFSQTYSFPVLAYPESELPDPSTIHGPHGPH